MNKNRIINNPSIFVIVTYFNWRAPRKSGLTPKTTKVRVIRYNNNNNNNKRFIRKNYNFCTF